MRIVEHHDASDFLAVNENRLLKEEAANNLILGLAYNLQRKDRHTSLKPPLLLSALHHGSSEFCCLRTPPHHLNVYATVQHLATCTDAVCNHLGEKGYQIPGVTGTSRVSESFAKTWRRLKNVTIQEKLNMMAYRLDRIIPQKQSSGKLRRAELADLTILTEWTAAFHRETFTPIDLELATKICQKQISSGALYLWEDIRPRSMAASTRATKHGIAINSVYTPKEFRGRGYASSCVQHLSARLLNDYEFCTLFTDLDNPISNSIYQKIGYHPIAAFKSFEFVK